MVMNDGREGGRVQGLVSIEVRIVAKPNPKQSKQRKACCFCSKVQISNVYLMSTNVQIDT